MKFLKRTSLTLLIASLAVSISSCGGGGGNSAAATTPVVTPTTTIVIGTDPLPVATRGVSYSTSIGYYTNPSVIPPVTWSVTSGALPPGLTFGPTDPWNNIPITGTPTTAGSFNFTLQVKDSRQSSGTREFTLVVDTALKIITHNLKTGIVNHPYSDFLQAVNGTPPYTWSAGFVPAGLTLNSTTGEISGTPTGPVGGGYPFSVQDSSSPALSDLNAPVGINIVPQLQILDTGEHFYLGWLSSQMISITGGVYPYTFSLVGGSLPPGISMTNYGVLIGTPTQLGTFNFTVQATDSMIPPQSDQKSIPVIITVAPPQIISKNPPKGTVGTFYSYNFAAVNGLRPLTWSAQNLPPGLTLSSSGNLGGTPTQAGTFFFNVNVGDSTSPPQFSDPMGYTMIVSATQLGRNDTIANATPLSNGSYQASISPYATATGIVQPDNDYYKLTAAAGSTVNVGVYAQGFRRFDPVIEIVDANGIRFTTCRNLGTTDGLNPGTTDSTPNAFDDPCVNDDIDLGANRDSYLDFLIPGAAGTDPDVTFYVRVLDWSGGARPDFLYSMNVSGVK